MAKIKIKTGMGGSRNGRSRWEETEVLKSISKKKRRGQDKDLLKREKQECE